MDEAKYWRCGINRLTACDCRHLCEIGDWARDYGAGEVDDLGLVANSAFAACLASTGAFVKVRVTPD